MRLKIVGGGHLLNLAETFPDLSDDYEDHDDIPNFDSSDLTFSFSQQCL